MQPSLLFFSHTLTQVQTYSEHSFPFALEESSACCLRWKGLSVRGKEWIVWVFLVDGNWNRKSHLHAPVSPPTTLLFFMSSLLLTYLLGHSRVNAITNSLARHTIKIPTEALERQKLKEKLLFRKNDFSLNWCLWGGSFSSLSPSELEIVWSLPQSHLCSHLHVFCYLVYEFMSVLSLLLTIWEVIV